MTKPHPIFSEVKHIFGDLHKINQRALAIIAVTLFFVPLVMTFLTHSGVKISDSTNLIMFIFNFGISLAGFIFWGAVALSFFDWLADRSKEHTGQVLKMLFLTVGYLVWILSAWAILGFVTNGTGYQIDNLRIISNSVSPVSPK